MRLRGTLLCLAKSCTRGCTSIAQSETNLLTLCIFESTLPNIFIFRQLTKTGSQFHPPNQPSALYLLVASWANFSVCEEGVCHVEPDRK